MKQKRMLKPITPNILEFENIEEETEYISPEKKKWPR